MRSRDLCTVLRSLRAGRRCWLVARERNVIFPMWQPDEEECVHVDLSCQVRSKQKLLFDIWVEDHIYVL